MALIDSLVSYWKLDETSDGSGAVTREDIHSTNDLTDINTTPSATGKINNGADLEASSSEYLRITDASQSGLDLTGNFSFSVWINLESIPSSGGAYPFISKRDSTTRQYMFRLDNVASVRKLFLFTGDGGGSNEEGVSVDWEPSTATWYHVAVTFNASDLSTRFYVNGAQQGTTQTLTRTAGDGTAIFALGTVFSGGSPVVFFDGILDEVGVWSKVLSDAEVTSLYNGGSGLAYPFATDYPLTADTGAFTLTYPNPTSITSARQLIAALGTFILTGQDVILTTGKGFTAVVGEFALTLQDTVVTSARTMAAEAGAFVLTSIDTGLILARNFSIAAAVGTFNLTMQTVHFLFNGATNLWTNVTKHATTWINDDSS